MYHNILKQIGKLEEALQCKVCKHILEEPLLIVNCGHSVCKKCFDKEDTRCPSCNGLVKSQGFMEDKQLKDLLWNLEGLKSCLTGNGNISVSEPVTSNKDGKENKAVGPMCSTPKVSKIKSLRAEVLSPLTSDESTVQDTFENEQTPSKPTPGRKSGGSKRNSSASSSSNTSMQSPVGNLNKKNPKGETLLHRAVIKGDINRVKDLLKQGAGVNTQDNNGWTPLHEASNHGFVELAKLLLDHGALVNVPSFKDNITPLHDCLLNDEIQIAILLVSRGADLHAKTSFGYTALDLCKKDEDRKTLTEACSPFIDANTVVPDSKVSLKQCDKIVFLSSNLSEDQKHQLQKCAQMLKAEILEDFKPEVTHVVTSCDNVGNCVRTMKILMGILSGKWIMNFQWVEVCLEYKKKVEEEVFEVQGTKNQPNTQGPKRGRLNYVQKFPPLFDGIYFFLHGNFNKPTPEREELSNLIHFGGGKLLSREPRPDSVASSDFMMPYHASSTALEDINHIILYQEKPPKDTQLRSGHVATTQVMWLISSISEFRLVNLKQCSPKRN